MSQSYGHLYDRQGAEVDLNTVLRTRKVNAVILDPTDNLEPKAREGLFRALLGNAYARQRHAIQKERAMLARCQAQSNRPKTVLCTHSIRDELHGPEGSEFRCLVCGQTGPIQNTTLGE